MADVPLYVVSEYSSSERRITPSWSIAHLKTKMEPITGIPPSCQRVFLKTSSSERIPVEANDEEAVYLQSFPLIPYAELHIVDTRPASAKPNFSSAVGVEKYVMPEEEYEKKSDSVLSWKKEQKLGRFDPNAPSHEQAKIEAISQEIKARGIAVGKRCRVGANDTRRGEIKYVGEVKEIPGSLGSWVGVDLDEPVGKNDGSIGGTRYWGEASELKRGVFVRPERVEVGDWPVMDDLEDMEEI
ncbi:CAP Gly-rich domain-containing protein [Lasiosphaeria miniovina]|uniref:CAP Gly-rich domain-containing protein n=1 Tax=Lasiosphaeria miniovina TaxID=1954250 RepID=A0AA40DN09_9PEZI|nr:CAP Gly-rich domain-containing protein [Lasiosphaeria miniovina]KAK0706837.1 CAP Gly-rich domain-containing protein [Lasiosphaeria miniovina]